MRYAIDVMKRQSDGEYNRVATTTDPHLTDAISDAHFANAEELFKAHIIHVTDFDENKSFAKHDFSSYEGWIEGLQRSHAWLPRPKASPDDEIQKHVNPSHYRGLLEGMPDFGWLDIESRRPLFREPAKFIAAVDLQESKYMMRLGQKDNELQERKKSLFYKVYCILYIENGGKPIKADLVHEWMSKMPKMPGKCM